ncbi:hypothetical protein GGX14DRAFT_558280 [Mycena pura]|uniref:Uncharacterized protein n=1 Tax=Mycena pura TaxID=153505 RepID=A0AAD6YKR0_9AGAR|nr:hypothetical protein GGX14DRAFT_558280 [Mycena pura]
MESGHAQGAFASPRTRGNTFDVGMGRSGQTAYDCPVSSGFLMGFMGRCGKDMDSLASLFLRSPVVSVSVSEVSYKQSIIGSSTGIAPVADKIDSVGQYWRGRLN